MMRPSIVIRFAELGLLLCLPVSVYPQALPEATLTVEVQKAAGKVSPMLYGLMTEEINYSYDGGLYAELVRNRTFTGLNYWSLLENGSAVASMKVDRADGPSAALPSSLRLTVEKAAATETAGIENAGYWGIPIRPETTYHASFYAKASDGSVGGVTVSLADDTTGKIAASATAPALTTEWKQYSFDLKTGASKASSTNHVLLTVQHPGSVWFSLVSLFPPTYKNRQNGNRIDLMEKLAAMKPAFLRFPGGNYLEGDHVADRFDWKKTIGPLVDRPTHPSPWRYRSSDGLGLLEFLEWCEDLHMQPVLAVYAGYSLAQDHVAPGHDLEPYVQDALDEIEYVTGDSGTKWGATRAMNGHPNPFPLTYVEVGNEDQFDRSKSYDGRYAQFYDAIKKKYPQLQVIATASVQGRRPDVVDDHYYRRPEEFFADVHHYDKIDRNGPKIFVGEWATRKGTPTPDISAALGDAAWMTGMERNSDLIVMSCYAPLLVNVNPGGMQWDTDLIGYDASASYGSPSYYAQVMFSNRVGDEIVESTLESAGPRLFSSITRDSASGVMFLKLVNAASVPQAVAINLKGASGVKATGAVLSLSGKTWNETNTISEPSKIVPVRSVIRISGPNFRHVVPPYAIQILEISPK